jgi:methionine biosynthesis protein MetW
VQPGERVLDLGCGDGSLLRRLIEERGAKGYGVELEDAEVLAAIRNGINVIQGNLEQGLSGFDDQTFNHVVLSRTLQTVRHTERILAKCCASAARRWSASPTSPTGRTAWR